MRDTSLFVSLEGEPATRHKPNTTLIGLVVHAAGRSV